MELENISVSFDEKIKEGKVLVDFFATLCGPCRMLGPIIEELASEVKEYKFYKVDVDEAPNLAKRYGMLSIPTLLIFENGELKDKIVGFKSKEEIKQVLGL